MTVHQSLARLAKVLNQKIIGQQNLVNHMLVSLLSDGHLLVEGAPGLAKTTAIKALASAIEGDFHRIQFTPDLLPADLTGTEIFRQQVGTFEFNQGPIFHNLLLADEINRAPAKVQSALLEAMGERQVTVGKNTYPLPELFMVMATQNPIEQEGTYPLPEAQLDRFLLYVRIDYPSQEAEKTILKLARQQAQGNNPFVEQVPLIDQKTIFEARKEVLKTSMAPALEEYLLHLVAASRDPGNYAKSLANWVRYGASPRASIALDRCSRAQAWLNGRDYVSPEDIHAVVYDVLRHRVLLNFDIEADGITTDQFISELISNVAIP